MRPFPTPELTWRPGESFLHVYALPAVGRDAPLGDLISRARAVGAAGGGPLAPVPDRWLHATVQMITVPAAEISRSMRNRLTTVLAGHLSGLPPLDLIVGPPLCGTGGVILDITALDATGHLTDAPWQQVRGRAETAIRQVLGGQALRYEPGPPHISLAYAAADTDSGPIQASLQRVRPGRAGWRMDALDLVDVTQDAAAHTYTWRPIARILLGDPMKPAGHDPLTAAGCRPPRITDFTSLAGRPRMAETWRCAAR
jgi:hypothetical protein